MCVSQSWPASQVPNLSAHSPPPSPYATTPLGGGEGREGREYYERKDGIIMETHKHSLKASQLPGRAKGEKIHRLQAKEKASQKKSLVTI